MVFSFGQGALRWEPSINQFATSWPPLSENPGAAVAIAGASSLVVYYPLALMINAPFIWLSLLKIAIVTVILASGLLFFRRWARSLPGVPAPEPVEIRDLQQVIREVKTRVSQFEHVTGGNLNQTINRPKVSIHKISTIQRDLSDLQYEHNLRAPVQISDFTIRNHSFFADFNWHLHENVNIILGMNGYGKSYS